jgi:hypothetical protein
MRTLFFGGIAVLALAVVGVYLLPGPARRARIITRPVPDVTEEQATTRLALRSLPRGPEVPEPIFEPIVVERAESTELGNEEEAETPQTAAKGFVIKVGLDFGAAPRPDADHEARRMPYADESPVSLILSVDRLTDEPAEPCAWMAGLLCGMRWMQEALTGCRLTEPEESEVKPDPEMGPEPPLSDVKPAFDPAMDYHRQYPSCPYTGRCPSPYPQR